MPQWKMPDYFCLVARDHHLVCFDSSKYLVIQLRFIYLVCRRLGVCLATGYALELAKTREVDIFNIVEGDLDALQAFQSGSPRCWIESSPAVPIVCFL